jgi:hypothetical protein
VLTAEIMVSPFSCGKSAKLHALTVCTDRYRTPAFCISRFRLLAEGHCTTVH